ESEFQELLDFVRTLQFDRVGTFTYSFEENTPSAELPNHIAEDVKAARRDALMELQQAISLACNQAWVGKSIQVLAEGQGDGITLARSFRDAPEIDGYVLIDGDVPAGEMLTVRVTGAMTYDLTATVDRAPAINITFAPGTVLAPQS